MGAVGAKLYYPDDTVQHAGVIIGMGGIAANSHAGIPRSSRGYAARLKIVQNFSAVTGACLMMRREVFKKVGGFDTRFSDAFYDIDLCLKIRENGYLIVFTPYAELYYRELLSSEDDLARHRERNIFIKEEELMHKKWDHLIKAGDPYYNPNLTLSKPDFSIGI